MVGRGSGVPEQRNAPLPVPERAITARFQLRVCMSSSDDCGCNGSLAAEVVSFRHETDRLTLNSQTQLPHGRHMHTHAPLSPVCRTPTTLPNADGNTAPHARQLSATPRPPRTSAPSVTHASTSRLGSLSGASPAPRAGTSPRRHQPTRTHAKHTNMPRAHICHGNTHATQTPIARAHSS